MTFVLHLLLFNFVRAFSQYSKFQYDMVKLPIHLMIVYVFRPARLLVLLLYTINSYPIVSSNCVQQSKNVPRMKMAKIAINCGKIAFYNF